MRGTPKGPYTVWVDHGCYEGWAFTDYETLADAIAHEGYGSTKHISRPVIYTVVEQDPEAQSVPVSIYHLEKAE